MTTVLLRYAGRRYLWTRHKLVHSFVVEGERDEGTPEEIWLGGKPKFAEIGRVYEVEQPSEGKYKIDRADPGPGATEDTARTQEWRLADRAAYLEHQAMATRKSLANQNNGRFDDMTIGDLRRLVAARGPAQRAAIITAVLTRLETRS